MKTSISKMLFICMSIAVALLLGVVVFSYAMAQANAREQALRYAERTLEESVTSVSAVLTDLFDGLELLAQKTEVYSFTYESPAERFERQTYIKPMLLSFTEFKTPVIHTQLYVARDDCSLFCGSMTDDGLSQLLHITRQYDFDLPFRNAILTDVYHNTSGAVLFGVASPVFASPRTPAAATNYTGALVALCDFSKMMASIFQQDVPMLLADAGNVAVTNSPGFAQAWQPMRDSVTMQEGQYRVLSAQVPNTPWDIYVAVSYGQAMADLVMVRTTALLFAGMVVLVLCFLIWQMYRRIVGPIVGIARQTNQIGSGLTCVESAREACLELDTLTSGINGMLLRVQNLNDHIMQTQLNYLQARIMFLQAQINPHLLYNNLECIRGMAAAGDGESVREMVSCMAVLYRYCISHADDTTLEDELFSVEQYARIIDLRYEGRFRVRVDVNDTLLGYRVPCMVLQPIVENAVVHGFVRARQRDGEIVLRARAYDKRVVIQIEDDGAGMAQEQMEKLNAWAPGAQADDLQHLGLSNVRNRLHLIYGEEAGVRFMPAMAGGLLAEISLPIQNPCTQSESKT